MNKICLSVVAVAALSWPAWGQKVEVQKPDRVQIVHVETSLNHLTVLEMSEPVITVAVGSSAFKVEWRENKVFIEPTDTNVATNLFVWTASGRFNYELDPAGAVPQMDFAIDQPITDPPTVNISAKTGEGPSGPSPADVLIEAKPIRLYGSISEKNRIAVYLTDSLEHDGQVLIRYTIRNQTKRVYVPGDPQVVVLNMPHYRESLYPLSNFQLSPDAAARLKWSGSNTPIEVTKDEIRSPRIQPGQETTGIVAIKLPEGHGGPTVLRLIFLADPKGPISATLVL
ncbi:MAG TPA: hypothetical protein VGR71_06515 [Nitrospira sp.]|nr:hypothetical protein [Nitrospira sp.]